MIHMGSSSTHQLSAHHSCHRVLKDHHVLLHLQEVKGHCQVLTYLFLPVKEKSSLFQCFKCTKHKLTFDNIDDYKVHNLNEHPGRYTCKDCGKSYQSNHHLNQHVTSIHLGMPYTCDVQGCTEFFSTSRGKEIHMLSHKSALVYKCNICSLEFDSQGELNSHKSTHTKSKTSVGDWCGLGSHGNLM